MSEPVNVWFIARHYLKGPAPALAIVSRSKSGSMAWAQLVNWVMPPKGEPYVRFPRTWYIVGNRYKIGTTVFLTELAAQRFLEGEADRIVKTASDYQRRFHQDKIARAYKIAHPDVYVDRRLTIKR